MITKACCDDVIQYSKFMIILKGTKWRQHQSKVLYEILIYKNLFIVIDFLSVLCVCSIYGHWTRDYFLKMYNYIHQCKILNCQVLIIQVKVGNFKVIIELFSDNHASFKKSWPTIHSDSYYHHSRPSIPSIYTKHQIEEIISILYYPKSVYELVSVRIF